MDFNTTTNYKYYATATNKDGKSFRVDIDSGFRPVAEKEAIKKSKAAGLKFEELHLIKGSNVVASTLTKFNQERRRNSHKKKTQLGNR